MSGNSAVFIALALGSLIVSTPALAQLTPPAGSAGAGNTPISGIPIRSRQSEGALRPQRHRKRRKYSAAPQQHPAPTDLLRIVGLFVTAVARRHTALCRRVATDHQRV